MIKLLDKVKEYIKEGDNRFDYPTIKAFVDRVVYVYLKGKQEKIFVKKISKEEKWLPEEKVISKKFEKFNKALQDVKSAIANKDIAKAKKFYLEARDCYVGLNNKEKKEVYDKLTELYKKITKICW